MNLSRKFISVAFAFGVLASLLTAGATAEMLSLSRIDEAIRSLNRQVQANPGNADAYFSLSRAYFQLGDWDHAIASGMRAVEINSSASAYHLWLGRAYGRKAETVNMAYAFVLARKVVHEFEWANELNPNDWPTRRDLAEFYVEAPIVVGGGEYKAEQLAARTQAADPVGASLIRAMIARKTKDVAGAERQFKQAIQQSGDAAEPWLDLARLYRDNKRWNEFDDAVRHALNSPKRTSEDTFDAGELLAETGRMLPQAAEALRLYLNGDTAGEYATAFRAHYLLGQVLEHMGDHQGAIGEYRSSLALASGYLPAQDALRRLGA